GQGDRVLAHYWWLLANDNNGIEECEQQCSLLSSDALRTEGWQRADTVARPPELAMPERAPIAPHGSTRSRCCMCGLQDKQRPNEHEKIQVVGPKELRYPGPQSLGPEQWPRDRQLSPAAFLQNYSEESESVGDVSRHPGASNMLGVWENVKLRTWCSDARGEQR
ncbi:hypothetical protein KUCAC02_013742, partial [Chaenocephalus aceratus]